MKEFLNLSQPILFLQKNDIIKKLLESKDFDMKNLEHGSIENLYLPLSSDSNSKVSSEKLSIKLLKSSPISALSSISKAILYFSSFGNKYF